MSDCENKERAVEEVFQNLRRTEIEAPAFLETRILARWDERRRGHRKFVFWRWAAGLTTGLSLALSVFLFQRGGQGDFEAFVRRPFVVRVSVQDLAKAQIARAEIVLPEGVYFDIEEFPELRDRKSLSLNWNEKMGSELVPFVLNSEAPGIKTVLVRFFSVDNTLLKEKKIVVALKEDA